MEVPMKPFVLLVLIAAVLTSPLGAQDSTPTRADSVVPAPTHLYRNPRAALILGSLIPGAGHIYAGEYWRGIANYEGTVASTGGGVVLILASNLCFERCNRGVQVLGDALGVVVVGAGIWHWVSTARDAPRAAERANAKHSRKAAPFKPIIDAPAGATRDWHVGVEIPW
jgi:hypothetical protein